MTNFPFEREPAYIRRLIRMRAGEVVRNAVCLGEVRDGSSEWLSDGTFKIVYVGRLVEQKRVDLLLISSIHSAPVESLYAPEISGVHAQI